MTAGTGVRARRPRRRGLALPRLDLELEGIGRNAVEGRFLPEDALLEVTELTARLDPELLHERAASVGVGVERLRLPSRPVERQHQLRAKALPQRVPLDQLLELADHGAVLTGRERVVDGELARPQPELLEAADLGSGERLVREVVERRAPPQLRAPRAPHRWASARRGQAVVTRRSNRSASTESEGTRSS